MRYRPFLVALALAVFHVPGPALGQEGTVPVTTRREPDAGVPARSFEASSVYVQVAYEVLPKRLQLFAKVDRFDPNRDRDVDATTTLSAGGSWFLRGHDLKLQANYLGSDVPGLPSEHKVLARFQAAF